MERDVPHRPGKLYMLKKQYRNKSVKNGMPLQLA
jgi:hypothetical protein